MKAKVNLKVRGVRGGSPTWNPDKGEVITFIDGERNYISVDAFEGRGTQYKRREKSAIEININDVEWKGTAEELAELITHARTK